MQLEVNSLRTQLESVTQERNTFRDTVNNLQTRLHELARKMADEERKRGEKRFAEERKRAEEKIEIAKNEEIEMRIQSALLERDLEEIPKKQGDKKE